MALKRVNFATAHDASTFTSARWNFQPVPDGFGGSTIQLVEIPPGNPRFAHNPATGEAEGLLIEEERTNLVTWSSDFTNANWTKTGVDVNTLSGESILVESDAFDFIPTAVSGAHTVAQSAKSVSLGSNCQLWVIAKSKGYTKFGIRDASTGVSQFIDLAAPSASMVDLGGGRYACRLNISSSVSTVTPQIIMLEPAATSITFNAWIGDGTSGIEFHFAQLEVGAQPTSPIITEGTTVTRTADIPAFSTGAWFNPAEGTFYIEVEDLDDITKNLGLLTNKWVGGAENNRGFGIIRFVTSVSFGVRDDDSFESVNVVNTASKYKIIASWNSSTLLLSVNGVTETIPLTKNMTDFFDDGFFTILGNRYINGLVTRNNPNNLIKKLNYTPRFTNEAEANQKTGS